jgi:cellulose synthase/poly-beta-1,6-N-acetylglucosamine synthase-like glycosyltransferase
METTVIISYYKAIDNLKLILMALNRQSNMNFEVILSEDDYDENTTKFFLYRKDLYNFPITHVCQKEDKGFRKNEMLNKSIIQAKTGKLIFIDGDCIPHKHFIKNYINSFKEGYIFEGRAVMLDNYITDYLKNKQSLKKLDFFSLFFSNSNKIKDGIYFPLFPLSNKKQGRGLVGRNWGIYKKHLIEINGFDMDYIHAGVGEDVDIEWRLKANGIKSKSMKNKSIVYHLFHEKVYSQEMVKFNYELLYKKQKENKLYCLNGLKTIGNTQ